jgi:hypothetical protein
MLPRWMAGSVDPAQLGEAVLGERQVHGLRPDGRNKPVSSAAAPRKPQAPRWRRHGLPRG